MMADGREVYDFMSPEELPPLSRRERDAEIRRYERPFSEEEAKAVDAHASYAEIGLANAMLLKRMGRDAWTREEVERTVAADDARAGKEPTNG